MATPSPLDVRIAGLDLSLTGTGLALNGLVSTVKSNAKMKIEERLEKIWDDIAKILYLNHVEYVAIEGLAFASQTGKAAERGGLHFIVRRELWLRDIDFAIVAPTARAKFATGKGNAGKDEVMIAVTRLWPEFNAKNNNEADAVVLYKMLESHLTGQCSLPKVNQDALDKVEWA